MLLGELVAGFPFGVLLVTDEEATDEIPGLGVRRCPGDAEHDLYTDAATEPTRVDIVLVLTN